MDQPWDYVVIGGGIMGAEVFRVLSQSGAKTLLIDAADFSSGTSSQSGMLIWGGLLYLKQGDLKAVRQFSKSRNKMIRDDPQNIQPLPVQYVRQTKSFPITLGFSLYSMLGGKAPAFPRAKTEFSEKTLLSTNYQYSYATEEALLQTTDARYVLDIILASQNTNSLALNYFKLLSGSYENQLWTLQTQDKITKSTQSIRARYIFNCAGPASESIHTSLGNLISPYKHVWSKGVYLCLKLPDELKNMLVIDLPEEKDVITYCPLSNTALWGPTEEKITDLPTGYSINSNDIQWLANKYWQCTGKKLTRDNVISYRCGVRPLAVAADYVSEEYTLNISRASKVHHFPDHGISTFYGGKFTGSADTVHKLMDKFRLQPTSESVAKVTSPWKNQQTFQFLNKAVVSPRWSLENEMCWHLEDYMRRRTPLHQTTPNGGFGFTFENTAIINEISRQLFPNEAPEKAGLDYLDYKAKHVQLDQLLKESL